MVTRPGRPGQLALAEDYRRAAQQGYLESYRRRRWEKVQEYNQWLSPSALPELTLEQALALYRASGGNRPGEFRANSVEDIRDSWDFLLYDTIKLEGRFDECVSPEGAYRLAGAGKELVSYLLCLRDPALFGVWNAAAERALKALDLYPETLRRGHWGLRYLDLLEALQRLRLRTGLEDFQAVDQFAYWVARAARTSRAST